MNAVTREWRALREAVRFFSRVPMGTSKHWDPEDLKRSLTYFPLVGWLVGGVAALSWWLSAKVFPPGVASGISLLATLVLTGAFHEDGLADVCDGFGGGTSKERVLAIMLDSRVGAFGVIGVVMALTLKWQSVAALTPTVVPWALWSGHAVSRGAACVVQRLLPYVRETENKSRTIAQPLRGFRFLAALVFALAPLACAPAWPYLWAVPAVFLTSGILVAWFAGRIGGYTGDCLGATQQICEIVFYLMILSHAARP